MESGDPLDDWLSSQPDKVHRKSKSLMSVIREAYPIGVPALIIKSQTDRLAEAGGYAFHLGTPDDVLRRICSWLLTNGHDNVLEKLIGDLWERHGREDVAIAALLLANVQSIDDEKAWNILSRIMGDSEPADALLLVIEELFRAKRTGPTHEVLLTWYRRGEIHSHLALLVQHAAWIRGGREKIGDEWSELIQGVNCPDGDSLITRIRGQLLSE